MTFVSAASATFRSGISARAAAGRPTSGEAVAPGRQAIGFALEAVGKTEWPTRRIRTFLLCNRR